MFRGCSNLSDIKALEKWNVSNGNNFTHMFRGCSKLSDIKALEKWNISNSLLKNIKYIKLFLYSDKTNNDCNSFFILNPLKYFNILNIILQYFVFKYFYSSIFFKFWQL